MVEVCAWHGKAAAAAGERGIRYGRRVLGMARPLQQQVREVQDVVELCAWRARACVQGRERGSKCW